MTYTAEVELKLGMEKGSRSCHIKKVPLISTRSPREAHLWAQVCVQHVRRFALARRRQLFEVIQH